MKCKIDITNRPIFWSYWGHEPLAHLRRMGEMGGSVFNLGEWAPYWYDRLHSEELISRAAEAGITAIYTHYFKGFGLEYEYDEMEDTRRLTEIAHRYNIGVLGYCQLGSLYYETIQREIPNLEDIVIRDVNGHIIDWEGEYYRWQPCYNSNEFMEYIKKVVTYGLEHVGLDGFHFDNSYITMCHCEKCQNAFRRFLEEHIEVPIKTLGLKDFKHVRIPYRNHYSEVHDPLMMLWLQYNSSLCAKVHENLFEHVKKISEKTAAVLHNPAYPRDGISFMEKGFEPSLNSKHCDYVFAENDSFLRVDGKKLISQTTAFKLGQLFGYKVFDSSWLRDSNGRARYPETEGEIERYLSQSMIMTKICGTPWLARSTKRGNECLIDDELQFNTIKRVVSYFKEHIDLYTNAKPINNLKILYYPPSIYGDAENAMEKLIACSDLLVKLGLPFSMISEDELGNQGNNQTLILTDIKFTTEALNEKVIEAVKRGVRVIIIGNYGIYNEYGNERDHNNLVFDICNYENIYQITNYNECELTELLKRTAFDFEVTTGVDGIIIETEILEGMSRDNKLLLHLLNPRNTVEMPKYRVEIEAKNIIFKSINGNSYDNVLIDDISISGNMAKFSICGMKTMTTVELCMSESESKVINVMT